MTNVLDENSIDILGILKDIWRGRKLIFKVSISFLIIGFIVSFNNSKSFTSQTTFVPQVSDDQTTSSRSSLGSLASLAGINLNTSQSSNDSYLSPLLYSKIIDSEEFSLNLLKEELINSNAQKFTVKEYLLSNKSRSMFNPIGFIKKYTVDLFFNDGVNEINNDIFENYNFISEEDYHLIHLFRQKFTIELNEKEGYIKVLASDKNAFISSQLVEIITKSLQSKIIEIRTNKVKERLEFSKEQYELKQTYFDSLQKRLALFKDSNKNISTASFRSQLQKLETEFQLQQNILINLASEYNNNKIKLNKDTPIFSVIDEVSIPNESSEPKRIFILLSYLLSGVLFSSIFLLVKNPLTNAIKIILED